MRLYNEGRSIRLLRSLVAGKLALHAGLASDGKSISERAYRLDLETQVSVVSIRVYGRKVN